MTAFACRESLQFSPNPSSPQKDKAGLEPTTSKSNHSSHCFQPCLSSFAWHFFHQTIKGTNLGQDKGSKFCCWKEHAGNAHTQKPNPNQPKTNHTQETPVNCKAEDQIPFLFLAAESIYPIRAPTNRRAKRWPRPMFPGKQSAQWAARSHPYLCIQV